METHTFVRLAAPAGIAAAIVGVPSDLYHFTIDSRAAASDTFLFAAHGLGLVLAMLLLSLTLVGLALRLGTRGGAAFRVAFAMAYTGTLLVLANIAMEAWGLPLAPEQLSNPTGYQLGVIVFSFGLLAAGWFGVSVSLTRHGLVPLPVAVVLCLGAVYGFTPFPGSYTILLIGVAVAATAAAAADRRSPTTAAPGSGAATSGAARALS